MTNLPTRADALKLDQQDALSYKRDQFDLEEGVIYLDGNSLGPPPKQAFADVEQTLKQDWARGLIMSQNAAGWFLMTDTLGNQLAKLLGASDGEIVVCDSTGINLYKALHAAISMQPGRQKIVAEASSFPTDLYIMEGVVSILDGMTIKLEGRDADDIADLVDEDTAVVVLNHVDYRSGVIRDIRALTTLAHASGALVITDVSHAAGVIPVNFHEEKVDFAIGCTYKYLNGGPGSPAFAYVASRHHGKFRQPVTGWFSHAEPFKFEPAYRQASGARALLTGTQPILSMIPVKAGLDIFEDVDIHDLFAKGKQLSALFAGLVEAWCSGYGVGFYSPKDVNLRNGQVSLTHENGYAVVQALIERRVIGDFRQPNVMRFGFAPLYLRYVDVWDAANHLREVLESEQWREQRFNVQNLVT